MTERADESRAAQAAAEVRSWVDEALAGFVAGGPRPVSCRPGCTACCHYPARVYAWELPGLGRVLQRMTRPQRERLARANRQALRRVKRARRGWRVFPEAEDARLAYCRAHVRCPLLGDDDLCVAYEVRPVHCRMHVVVSDPALCAGGDKSVMVPDLEWLRRELDARVEAAGLPATTRGALLVDAVARLLRGG